MLSMCAQCAREALRTSRRTHRCAKPFHTSLKLPSENFCQSDSQ